MQITIIYKLNPNTDTDEVVALMQSLEDAEKAVIALNSQAQKDGKAAHGDDWEEYARFYYAKEMTVTTSEEIIATL